MENALIGHTGFVGTTLRKQTTFDALFRSTTIDQVRGKTFDTVVCAGAPAQKWIANKQPEEDRKNIDQLIAHLDTLTCRRFVLISTVDVFKSPINVDESTPVDEANLHAYGLNRRRLEAFVETRFPQHLIVRLPGLVGTGLRKNVIYDFLNENNMAAIESRGVFQFYPMANLWFDIEKALSLGLTLIHLTAAPVSVAEISESGFGKPFTNHTASVPGHYDMRTRHAEVFGGVGHYQYSVRETIQAVRAYAQSEPTAFHSAAVATS